MRALRLLSLLPLILLAACAIKAPQTASADMCRFVSYPLDVEDVGASSVRTSLAPAFAPRDGAPRSMGDLVDEVASGADAPAPGAAAPFGRRPADSAPVGSEAMLLLSGGSEHGAFGAGFLHAWKRNAPGGRLPAFRLVTGISTGAILATFAFVNDTQSGVDGYSILRESDLLKLFVPVKDGDPTTLSYVKLLRKGALGDLAPLRARLHRFIPETMIVGVYRQSGLATATIADDHRLLVGVVDLDTGRARALDLTDMARQHHDAAAANNPAAAKRRWDCYIDAVVASSSAPMAALPVFIDNRMYVDGGARFGMFFWELRDGAMRAAARRGDAGPDQHLFMIINGDQQLPPKCGKIDPAYCPDGEPPTTEGYHRKWSFLPLALRSEKILANQVYRFSAASVAAEADQRKLKFHSALIRADALAFEHTNDTAALGPPITQSCAKWRDADRLADDPLQFEARYMRCMIAYGADAEGRFYRWHELPVR
jgi:predicted acylesterase/phospholipase RssA